jgi:DNA-binding response OmpR family regulator
MREAISCLQRGEDYLYVVINEDSIPNFMDSLPELCRVVRTHVFVITHSYSKAKYTMAIRLGADAYAAFGETAKEDNDCAFVHLNRTPRWMERETERSAFLVGGEIVLDPNRRKAYVRESPLTLRNTDYDLLHYFMINIDIALSSGQILFKVWGREDNKAGHKFLWNHVCELRRTIERVTGSGEYIRTEIDYGYRFQPPYQTTTQYSGYNTRFVPSMQSI